jgi:hypothetical protein
MIPPGNSGPDATEATSTGQAALVSLTCNDRCVTLALQEKVVRKQLSKITKDNLQIAGKRWPGILNGHQRSILKCLSQNYGFCIAHSDLLLLDGAWYVTHAGLLRLAERRRCFAVRTSLEKSVCDPAADRWVFKAVVYKSSRSRGFVGHGDAHPGNVSPQFRGSELRIAETRAICRALRRAYGIPLCSLEELGTSPLESRTHEPVSSSNGNNHRHTEPQNHAPRLRDRLCLLIRKHRLDAAQVRAYAAAFCEAPNLRDASRERIESFVNHLAERATTDRDALLCQLSSYANPSAEVRA